ncbi:PH domain-containing protein [Nocardioides bruguierae]|uniref:PH domain-containing protein n=1 Tax=Nocardioides bruguierae TaxID=2945102 RepID=A0A9X2DB08_9ACTN|nr:PH domain-containing protein [Nocardioides bruguierae]MCM0621314.1 PH domain-containing protein [Nocardioides bruguierae]
MSEEPRWQRLDPRMLLVHPLRQLASLLPALAALFIAGRAFSGPFGGFPWEVLGVAALVAAGVWRYLATEYRITPGRVELRRGLLQRTVVTAPLDRVRTIDLSTTLVHRLLGLSTVRVGTGSDGPGLSLDALRTGAAEELRARLLARAAQLQEHRTPEQAALAGDEPTGPDDSASPGDVAPGDTGAATTPASTPSTTPASTPSTTPASPPTAPAPTSEEVLLRLDPRWALYAPLSTAGLALMGVVLGGGSQAVVPVLQATGWDAWLSALDVSRLGLVAVLALVGVAALVVAPLLAMAGYLVAGWGLTLTRGRGPDGETWQVRKGLLTTTATTVDVHRVAGLVLEQPVGLRLAGAARLQAMTTGLASDQAGTLELVPAAPRRVSETTGAAVLGTPDPLTVPLVPHGPAAVRRRWTRALVAPAVLTGVAALLASLAPFPDAWEGPALTALRVGVPLTLLALLVLAVPVAVGRARALGHALTPTHLVARQGSLLQRRHALDCEHVIGLTLRDTWFQRREGLVSLDATTAGGPERVTVLDVDEAAAVGLAVAAQPGLMAPFVERA